MAHTYSESLVFLIAPAFASRFHSCIYMQIQNLGLLLTHLYGQSWVWQLQWESDISGGSQVQWTMHCSFVLYLCI